MQSKLRRKTLNVSSSFKLGKLRALRTVFRKIQRILKLAELKIVPAMKITIKTISKIPRNLKLVKVEITPFPKSRYNTKIPSQKPSSSTTKISDFPIEVGRTLDGFLSLPMWFTIPVIFAGGFTLEIVVSTLMRIVA
jgi:hypothetical protein